MLPVFNVVLPIFAVIGAGYLCGRRGLLGEDNSIALNLFVYWVALPALLFKAMATVSLASVVNVPFFVGFLFPIAVLWLVVVHVARYLFGLSLGQAGLHGMNGVYSNTGYIGIPLAIAAFGDAAALPAIIATVFNTAFVVGVAILLLESDRNADTGGSKKAVMTARRIATNPMLVAPVAGLAYAATGLPLPKPAFVFLDLLGNAAGPCALFSIGLFMVGKPQGEGQLGIAAITVTKLVLHPALTALMVLVLFPADLLWAKVAVLMAALPTGTGSYVLAQAYGVYVLRTSSAILLTTLASVVAIALYFSLLFPPS